MKEFIYLGIVALFFTLLLFRDMVKHWFRKDDQTIRKKQSVIGITYWVPVKKYQPHPKMYPSHDSDIIQEWIDSLECSDALVNGKKIFVMDENDVEKLRQIIRYKYGYIIE